MFFIDDEEFTKYGYYDVEGFKTLSKLEAWQLSKGDFNKIKFIYNDYHFSKIDWSVEPKEDIYELFRQRAQQIREKYDYVVLVYSGGVDSHTVLETFLRNNIHINEICSFGNPELVDKEKSINIEVFNSAIPFINSLDLKKLGTKFRFIDISQTVLNEQFLDKHHFDNFQYYNLSISMWMSTANSHVLKSKIPEHLKLASQGKKICYVWGFEKPSLDFHKGNWYTKFVDNSINFSAKQYNNRILLGDKFNNFYDETFYICKEFPQITFKQCHLLIKYMKTLKENDVGLKSVHELPIFGPWVQFNENLWLSKRMVDSCVYPKAVISNFKDDKLYTGSQLFSKKDSWFYESNHEHKTKYVDKMMSLVKNYGSFFRYRDNLPFSTKPVFSKFYKIGKKPEENIN